MFDIELVAKIYARIEYERDSTYTAGMRAQFPKGSKMLAELISGYLNHRYEVARSDFYNVEGASEDEAKKRPTEHDVYSYVLIKERPAATALGKLERRDVRIHLNIGTTSSGEPLNRCWRRFCCLKEVCQAIIYEEFESSNSNSYPRTLDFSRINALFERINNEPFSLWDFGDPEYDPAHFTENAAELLALGLLYPFDHALEHQKALNTKYDGDLSLVDLKPTANYYKVPRRYVELMLTWKGLADFVATIDGFEDNLD